MGTKEIAFIEILRLDPGVHHFQVVKRWEPDALDVKLHWTDPDMQPGAIYYASLRQHGNVRDRIAMAWSSPIWID